MYSVGAYHDGEHGNNECSIEQQFIMAPYSQAITDSTFNNRFRFSHCSVRSIRKYINTLNAYVFPNYNTVVSPVLTHAKEVLVYLTIIVSFSGNSVT